MSATYSIHVNRRTWYSQLIKSPENWRTGKRLIIGTQCMCFTICFKEILLTSEIKMNKPHSVKNSHYESLAASMNINTWIRIFIMRFVHTVMVAKESQDQLSIRWRVIITVDVAQSE